MHHLLCILLNMLGSADPISLSAGILYGQPAYLQAEVVRHARARQMRIRSSSWETGAFCVVMRFVYMLHLELWMSAWCHAHISS